MAKNERNTAGSNNPNAKLTKEDIREMFEMRRNGALQREIATKFNVHQAYVSSVLRGKKWSAVRVEVYG